MNAVLRQTGAERWGCSVERDRIAHRHKTPTIANTHMLSARNLVLLCFALVLAACATIGLVSARADDPKPVDFSFSLTCHVLEGELKVPLVTTIHEYEQALAKAKADSRLDEIYNDPIYKGLVYDDNARVAYYHGKADPSSYPFLWWTYVKEVTPEMIFIDRDDSAEQGGFDRRTGDGYVKYDRFTNDEGYTDRVHGRWSLYRDFQFDDCKPSPPAKF